MTHILACIDDSRYAPAVCEYAAWAAERLDVSVTLLHVVDDLDDHGTAHDWSGTLGPGDQEALLAAFTAADEQRGRAAQQYGQRLLDQALVRTRATGATQVVARQRSGTLVDAVTDLEADANLIVIGKGGPSADSAAQHLGSNLERVVRAVHKPMLVSPPEFRPVRRFLIAYDGGQSMRRAIVRLAHTALLRGAECHVLMVHDDQPVAHAELTEATGPLLRAGFPVTLSTASGDPDEVILSEVDRVSADLLVMGAYGHSRIRTLIVGSTTTAILRNATVPVLVFRR